MGSAEGDRFSAGDIDGVGSSARLDCMGAVAWATEDCSTGGVIGDGFVSCDSVTTAVSVVGEDGVRRLVDEESVWNELFDFAGMGTASVGIDRRCAMVSAA